MNWQVHEKGDRHERVAEPLTREMVLQIPRCVGTKIPEAEDLRVFAKSDWRHVETVMRAGGNRVTRRARAGRPCPFVLEHSTEVQRGKHNLIFEREVGDPNPSRVLGTESQLYWVPFLGARILCEHGRFGRTDDTTIHP